MESEKSDGNICSFCGIVGKHNCSKKTKSPTDPVWICFACEFLTQPSVDSENKLKNHIRRKIKANSLHHANLMKWIEGKGSDYSQFQYTRANENGKRAKKDHDIFQKQLTNTEAPPAKCARISNSPEMVINPERSSFRRKRDSKMLQALNKTEKRLSKLINERANEMFTYIGYEPAAVKAYIASSERKGLGDEKQAEASDFEDEAGESEFLADCINFIVTFYPYTLSNERTGTTKSRAVWFGISLINYKAKTIEPLSVELLMDYIKHFRTKIGNRIYLLDIRLAFYCYKFAYQASSDEEENENVFSPQVSETFFVKKI